MNPEFLPAALPPTILSAVAVSALTLSDQRGHRAGRYLFKPLSALAFLWLAVTGTI